MAPTADATEPQKPPEPEVECKPCEPDLGYMKDNFAGGSSSSAAAAADAAVSNMVGRCRLTPGWPTLASNACS